MQAARPFIPSLVVFLLRILAATFRWRVVDRCGFTNPGLYRPMISILWHNRLLVTPSLYQRSCSFRRAYCLTSPSKDGAIIAGVMKHFKIGSIRGSSSRRGATAMREMAAVLEQGNDVAVTPDGPRGPKYTLHPGALKLAQLTGAPLVLVHIKYSRYWELKSWDAFRIPKPFARVDAVFGPMYEIPAELSKEEFEELRARLEAELCGGEEGATQRRGDAET